MPDAPAKLPEVPRVIAHAYKGNNLSPGSYEFLQENAPVELIEDLEYFFDAPLDEATQRPDGNAPFSQCLGIDGNPRVIRIYYQKYADVMPSTPLFEEREQGEDDELEDRQPTLQGIEPNEDAWAQMNINLQGIDLSKAFGDRTYDDVVYEMDDRKFLQIIAHSPDIKAAERQKLEAFLERQSEEGLSYTLRFSLNRRAPADMILLRYADETGDECGAHRAWLENTHYYRQDPQGETGELQDADLIAYDCTDLVMGKVTGRDFIEGSLPAGPMNPARADGSPLVPWQAIVDAFDDDDDAEAEGAQNWLSVLYAARHYGEEGWEFIARTVLDEMDIAPIFPDELVESFHRRLDSAEQITARPGKGPHQRAPGETPDEGLHQ